MSIKRVTTPLLLVLEVVIRGGGRDYWAYRLSQETGLAPGTIQPILTRLEDEGWLEARWEAIDVQERGRRPRRLYRLTETGAREGATLLQAKSPTMLLREATGGAPG